MPRQQLNLDFFFPIKKKKKKKKTRFYCTCLATKWACDCVFSSDSAHVCNLL